MTSTVEGTVRGATGRLTPSGRSGGGAADRLLVLCWHNVDATWCFPASPGAGRRGLRRQLLALRRGMTVVPLGAAVADLAAGRPLPPRAVALTFDDGYADNHALAAPLLRELSLPATFFLVPGFLSGQRRSWWEAMWWAVDHRSTDRLSVAGHEHRLTGPAQARAAGEAVSEVAKALDGGSRQALVDDVVAQLRPYSRPPGEELWMDWDAARDLVAQGFEVGSHTSGHDILAREGAAEQAGDLAAARSALQRELDVPVELLAYPNGRAQDYDAGTLAAAGAAGHAFSFTTRDGWNTAASVTSAPHELRRTVMYPERGLLELALMARSVAGGAR